MISIVWIAIFFQLLTGLLLAHAKQVEEMRYIKCASSKGHMDHYYHFLYACVIPVAVYRNQVIQQMVKQHKGVHVDGYNSATTRFHLLQLVLCESPIGKMKGKMIEVFPHLKYSEVCPKEVTVLPTYDHSYGAGIIDLKNVTRGFVIRQFFESSPPTLLPPSPIRILLIGRGETSSSQPSAASQKNAVMTTGSERRSIPNLNQLDRTLKETFGAKNVVTAFLETMSLHEQFYLFRSANLVIAQHGAALANIVFMHSTAKGVIEITPYNSSHYVGKYTHALPNCFRFAAFCVNVPYLTVKQSSEFAPVDVAEVVRSVKTMIRH